MYIDEKKSSSLAKFLNQFNLAIIDTCSLMEDGFCGFADDLRNSKVYQKKDLKIFVLKSCLAELKKHSKDTKNDSKRIDSLRAIKILKSLKRNRSLQIKNVTQNANFADNVIYTFVSTHRISNVILVITQDKYLCQDLKLLNRSLSQGGRPIVIYKVNKDGDLEPNEGRPDLAPVRPIHAKRDVVLKTKPNKKELRKPDKVEKKLSPALSEVVVNDTKLKAMVSNPKVKRFEKIEALHDQLDRVKKLKSSDLKKITLRMDVKSIESTLKELEKVNEVKSTKVTETKKVAVKKVSKTKKATLDEVKGKELRLMANISNPTYPTQNKINDLKEFKDMIVKLKDSDKASLKLSETKIDELLKTIK